MSKIAIVFPGQASQYVGMGKDLYDSNASVRKLYEIASGEIGEDIAKLSFEGPAEKLTETRFTQPAILLHSLSVLWILKDRLPKATLTAGHSLGEYGALSLAGALSPVDAVKAVVKRAALMEEACRKNPGTMAAIIGLDEEKINEICEKASAKGVVVPANFNSANQIVISGAVAGVEEAARLCKEAGAKRAMMLQVGGAFHSPLMEPAREGMEKYLDSISIEPAMIPVVANVSAQGEGDPSRIKKLLIEQITAPVRWQQTMEHFASQKIKTVIEVGPGKVLAGLAKRGVPDAKLINLDKLEDIENFSSAAVG